MLSKIVYSIFPSFIKYRTGFKNVMDVKEAKLILGVESDSKIYERYMKLIKINHPDKGGSPYLAAKIIEAKKLLLNEKNGRF